MTASPHGAGIWTFISDVSGSTFALADGTVTIDGRADPTSNSVSEIYLDAAQRCHRRDRTGDWTWDGGAWVAEPASSSVPPPAAAVGYMRQTFGPSLTVGGNWNVVPGAQVHQNSDGSVTIAGGANSYNRQLETAVPGSGGAYVGTVFGGGLYTEATLSWAGPLRTDGGWPSFWANDIECQSGNPVCQWQGQAPGYWNWVEPDFMEWMEPHGYGGCIHNWYGEVGSGWDVHTGAVSGSPFTLPAGTNPAQPHRYGWLWVPATVSAAGYAEWYFDGQRVGNRVTWRQYSASAPPPPVVGSTAFSVLDARRLYLILGSGPGNPMTVAAVGVWQR